MSRARPRFLLAVEVLGALMIAGCGGGGTDVGTNTGTDNAIAIALSSGTLSVAQGASGNVTVTLTRTGGFTGDVALAVTGMPTGITVNSATISAGTTTPTLSFLVAATVAAGNSSITINASGSGVAGTSASLTLTVTAAPATGSYTLAATPSSPSLAQGGSAIVVITLTRSGGFAGSVALSVSGAANGLTATLASAATTGTTDTLTLNASASATVGAQTLTVKGTAAGLADQTTTVQPSVTAVTSSGNVTWLFCGSLGTPMWVAFQDGTSGPWTQVTGANQSYTFNITQAVGGIAYVVPYLGGGFDLEVFYGSKADLQGRASEVCSGPGTKTVTAPVAGAVLGGLNLLSLGTSSGTLNASLNGVTFSNVPNGTLDLIAGSSPLNLAPATFNQIKMLIRRNLNPADNSALTTIDFGSGEAFTPVVKNLTINNLGADVPEVSLGYFTANNASAGGLYADNSGGIASRTYAGVPAANQAAGDLHLLTIIGTPNAATLTQQRYASFAFHDAVDTSLALGPTLNTPTVSVLAATGYSRLRAAISVQPEYDKLFGFSVQQTGALPRRSVVQQTVNYSAASSLNLDVPDLSSVPGFDVNWGLKAGAATTYTLMGTGWSGTAGIGRPPFAAGLSYMLGTRLGSITP
jgi:hypothetical protein